VASGTRLPWRLSTALWAERRAPALARRLRPSPVLPGEPGPLGTVYRGTRAPHADGSPLIVLAGDRGAAPDWLGSALASALGAVSVVLADAPEQPEAAGTQADRVARLVDRLRATVVAATSLGADSDRIAVIGVGDAAAPSLTVAAAGQSSLVRRLVLLVPTAAPDLDLGGSPPVFLQSSPQSGSLAVSRSLEIDLREAGVAVRPVEYAGLADAWVRYPRFTPGARRAVEDIVAFLRRGFGIEGTFSGVIPGWDLT
jgi:hypothetical protein